MPEHARNILSILIGVSAFILVLSLWMIGMVIWITKRRKRDDQVRYRLEMVSTRPSLGSERVLRLWHDGKEATTIVPGRRDETLPARMQKMLIDAGMQTELSNALIILSIALVVVGAGAYAFTSSFFIGLAAPAAVLVVLWLVVTTRVAKNMARFEAQLIDAMELAARSLRVGHPLIASFQLIAEEVPAPVGELFGRVCQQQALGMAMDEALRSVSEEVYSPDMRLFATSVVIQLRSGGNLADMMQRLSNIIRERNRLTRRVKVMTAQTQFSKRVLLALPFLIFVGMNIINPNYMRVLYSTMMGQVIMMVAAFGMFLGWMTMNYLSRITP